MTIFYLPLWIGFIIVMVFTILIVRFRNPLKNFFKVFFGSLILAIILYMVASFLFGVMPPVVIPIFQIVAIIGNLWYHKSQEGQDTTYQ